MLWVTRTPSHQAVRCVAHRNLQAKQDLEAATAAAGFQAEPWLKLGVPPRSETH